MMKVALLGALVVLLLTTTVFAAGKIVRGEGIGKPPENCLMPRTYARQAARMLAYRHIAESNGVIELKAESSKKKDDKGRVVEETELIETSCDSSKLSSLIKKVRLVSIEYTPNNENCS